MKSISAFCPALLYQQVMNRHNMNLFKRCLEMTELSRLTNEELSVICGEAITQIWAKAYLCIWQTNRSP